MVKKSEIERKKNDTLYEVQRNFWNQMTYWRCRAEDQTATKNPPLTAYGFSYDKRAEKVKNISPIDL